MESSTTTVIARDYGLGGRGAHLVIPSILGPILAALLVFNRVYWRITLIHQIGRDDICIFLSLIFLFAHCTVNLVAVDHGYGREQAKLSSYDLYKALQMFYLDQIFYKFTINLTKLSILFLYLRIFSQCWFRRTCYACIAVVSGYAIASIVATIFQCTPVTHVFNKKLPGHCIDITAFWYANAIYSIVTDIVILASVPGVVWSLSLSKRQRVGLTLVFGLGIFVFATSILRMTTLAPASKAPDITHGTLKSTMWTTIEASSAVVCACLPMMRTPIQKLFPKIFPLDTVLARRHRLPRLVAPANPTVQHASSKTLISRWPRTTRSVRTSPTAHPSNLLPQAARARRDASTMALPPTPPGSEADTATTVAEDWSPSRAAPRPLTRKGTLE